MNTVKIEAKQVNMIAHRGLSGLERENTCPAFVAAGNRSYFGIETDVHVTKDGKFVIIHDETTDRVSGGAHRINVEESDYAAVESIVLPELDGSTNRKDIRIPLLIDYVKICQKYEKVCVLEVKNPVSQEDLKRMVEEIRGTGYLERVIFISFDMGNCLNLRKLLPESRIQFLAEGAEVTGELIETLVENRLDLDAEYHMLTRELVARLHDRGIQVNCWTCDSKEDAETLVGYGVDFITSNILE